MLTLERDRPESCLSDLSLDGVLAGDGLDADARASADAHLAQCAACRKRLKRLRVALKDFQENGPPRLSLSTSVSTSVPADVGAAESATPATPPASVVYAESGDKTLPLRRRRLRRYGAGVGALVAAAAAVLLLMRPLDSTSSDEVIKRKGAADAAGAEDTEGRIGFYVKRGDVVRPGVPGMIVHPDDRLRFTYTLHSAGYLLSYLAVLSVDGAGVASVYYPQTATAAAIKPGRQQALPASTILDATTGSETLYGLFCDRAVTLEPIRAALEANPLAPHWPAGCTVHTLTIDKRDP